MKDILDPRATEDPLHTAGEKKTQSGTIAFTESHAAGAPDNDPRAGVVIDEKYLREWCQGLSTVAHDLRTPLAVIGGYVELLLDGKLGPLNERQIEVLQEMRDNEARLQRFIKDFLTFDSMRFSPVRLKLEQGNLNDCMSDLVSLWMQRFQKKRVALFFVPCPELPPFLFDYYKIQHVVSNLLDNALKFTPPSGTVWLQVECYKWERRTQSNAARVTRERRKRSMESPNAARVIVSDSGPGVPPEFQQDIFHEFFRVDRDSDPGGTGLGLAIARRLVQLHSGKIWVETDSAPGSRFSFLLPFRPDLTQHAVSRPK